MSAEVLTRWQLDPGLTAALAAAVLAYLAGVLRVRRWPARRTAAFLGGIAVLAIALESGLHTEGERLLSAHMVQHLVLTLAAAPLLLAGAPVVLALRALRPAPRRALARVVVGRPGRIATSPALALALFTVVMVGSHLPWFYDAALTHPAIHVLEHLLFVGSALLLWAVILAIEPLPHAPSPLVRILVVMASMPAMIAVGVGLATASSVVYRPYAATGAAAALADQRTGGMIMWVGGSLVMAAIAVAVGWQAILREERRAEVGERLRRERAA